jgi:peptide deformylase
MILEIVHYGHPALRSKGRRVEQPDERLRTLAQNMLETMAAAEGVGLAAQQVGVPVQLCVLDVRDIPDRPSRMWIEGRKVDLADHMPMVLCNPEIEEAGAPEEGTEGCLSFPGIVSDIKRPRRVKVRAMGLDGQVIEFEADGLLARAVQHEHDHLHGILFIDRMDPADRTKLEPAIRKIAGL